MATGIKDKVAIIGMGCSKFGERWDAGTEQLLTEAFGEALKDAGVREKLKPVMEVETSTPEALRGMVERDIERYGNLVRDVGMKVE